MPPLSFLDLPGEIRNQIYAHLLLLPPPQVSPAVHPKIYPQILSTSRAIHAETLPILYSLNTYHAHTNLLTSMPRLRPSYPTISLPSLIALIRKYYIRVRLDCDPNFSAQKVRDAFRGVEELTVEVFQAQYGSSDYNVLTLFESVRGVGRASVTGSVSGFRDYAAWLEVSMTKGEAEEVVGFGEEGRQGQIEEREYDMWTVGAQ